MNIYKRSLLLLLSLCMLFPVFSSVAHAEVVDIPGYNVLQENMIDYKGADGKTTQLEIGLLAFTPHNGVDESKEIQITNTINQGQLKNSKHYTRFLIKLQDPDNPTDIPNMLKAKTQYTVTVRNLYHSLLVSYERTVKYIRNPENAFIYINCDDGYTRLVTDYEIQKVDGNPYVDIVFNIKPEYNVNAIVISLVSDIDSNLPDSFWDLPAGFPTLTSYFGEFDGDDEYILTLEIESDESGLLKSLIEWVKSIKNKVDDTFSSVTSGFSNVINSVSSGFSSVVTNIIELPQKLWILISDGLKSLFVPTEEQITEYSTKWDSLLSERFGALYEVGDVVESVVGSITNTPATIENEGIIIIPEVSLENYGIPFSFGGYDVDIRPEGFDSIITICKRVISVICTLAFVNALRRRYESVIGG